MAKRRNKLFQDLLYFVELELTSGDLEPWAELLKVLRESQREEQSLWLVSLYNTYDSMSSAWGVYKRWQSPVDWLKAKDRQDARSYPIMQERRNLHGGRVNKRLESYASQLPKKSFQPQLEWLSRGCGLDHEAGLEQNFTSLVKHTRQVWGVGRQASFEWAEFLGKVNEFPVSAGHAFLWESSGPRESLQILYDNDNPTQAELDGWAEDLREWLAEQGYPMRWEDFETVICDFKVMLKGRYYPGRHLAALRGEIEELHPKDKEYLLYAFQSVIPYPWNEISPGIDKSLMPHYQRTGEIISKPHMS